MSRHPVLIANRGEIAIRIARSCKALGFPTVAIYSEADRFSEHVKYCDQAYSVGGASPQESYLNIERILGVASASGAKFIHPGFGFLSERPQFVEACEKAGITFVGPSAQCMRQMGDKVTARQTVDQIKVPRVPGSAGAVQNAKEATQIAEKIGYPVLLKATAGGGGKGMRRVDSTKELSSAFDSATREAQAAFGEGALYVEKFILEPHHVEIQVFGDGKGKAIHLGERECSIQRRHQKIWEESPSPILNQYPETRKAMQEAAVRIACHIQYAGAGTLEFIVDGKGNFFFLEMNTRLQVEHPVTEWVTGVDLVAWQLLLAAGEFKLPEVPETRGASIEARIYAEDPKTFLPAPGVIERIQAPSGPFVRWDSSFSHSGEVSIHYDPMISKLSVWAPTREEALGRLQCALDETRVLPKLKNGKKVGGLKTNLSLLRNLVRHEAVRGGLTTTDLIAKYPELTSDSENVLTPEVAIAISLYQLILQSETEVECPSASHWAQTSRREGVEG